jgi:hypothetical protein
MLHGFSKSVFIESSIAPTGNSNTKEESKFRKIKAR